MGGEGSQLDLFDIVPGPNVRPSDPDTSHWAAEVHKRLRAHDRRLALITLGRYLAGLTDYELADRMGRQQNSAGKRRGELRDLGLVVDTGARRPAPSGSLAIVWRINAAGLSVLLSLGEDQE